jgi:hypothetical protein
LINEAIVDCHSYIEDEKKERNYVKSRIKRQIKKRRLSLMNHYRILIKSHIQREKKFSFLHGNVMTNSNSDQNYEQEEEGKKEKEQKALFVHWLR